MRHLLKTSMVLLLILIFSGCEKSPDLTLKEQEEDSFETPFHEEITDTYLAIFQLISTGMKKAITQPQLYFLGEVGDTRGCPDSSVAGGATYPKTMTLDFVNCNSAGIVYNGTVPIIFNAALGDTAAAGPEIVVPAVSGIMINGYTFDLTGPISLDRNSNSTNDIFSYDFSLGGDIISTKDGTTTTLPSGSCGTFGIGSTDSDDPTNPISYIDNPFDVTLKQTEIVCASATASHLFCVMTGEEALSLDPTSCSCPTDGDLEIVGGACGSTGGAISDYDFGFDGRNSDSGACDNFVNEVTIIDFISYEGEITAIEGPLEGRTSTDIGVDQQGGSPVGTSLQLTDAGSTGGAAGHGFTWTDPTTSSYGMINAGQTIGNTTTPTLPWINEIHYDNDGGDANEGIEIAGPAGLDLGEYCLIIYNGNGTILREPALRGAVIPDEGNGYGAIFISTVLQNDDEAIALVKKDIVAANFCAGR